MLTSSPYLSDLAARLPDTVAALEQQGPDAVCDAALGALAALPPDLPRAALAAALREAKAKIALATALADLEGAWDLGQVTQALSDLAEGALRAATAHLLLAAHRRGELGLPHPAAPARGSGFVVLAMGKLGGRELNYSSDIDLILLYDPAAHPGREAELGPVFARLARDLVALMAERSAGGYVFRVDLRLRPDPGATPPAVALPGALAYYESLAQTWERAALIKARPVAGDLALGRRFLDAVRPMIWRRYLDFAAMADIRAMKRRIDRHRGFTLGVGDLPGHDLKLGQGGIREIEFCAQALQLVWGGRDPALRVAPTLAALAALEAAGHLPAAEVAALGEAYRFLRRAEHRLQMVEDRQTHRLPETEAGLDRFAGFFGFADPAAFRAETLRHLGAVQTIFSGLFREEAGAAPADALPAWAGPGEAPWEGWLAGRARAFRSERGRALLRDLLPSLLDSVARQPDPPAALRRLGELFERLPAGVTFLSTLRHNPALIERLGDVLGAAPWLADHLATVPSALDGLVAPLAGDPGVGRLLRAQMRDARGFDDALAIASRFVRGEAFAIAVGELAGTLDVDAAGAARTALADAVIVSLLPRVMREHEGRYGTVEGGGMAVVALGKAGSGEMMAGSDLDLMLIYDHAEDGESSGPRRLPASQYYARAAQALVGALTVPTRDGPLFEVDMRLRPSGRAGPVAVSLASFRRYHAADAWVWERLALTRARVVAGPGWLRRRAAAAIMEALGQGDPARVRPETVAMRARIARDLPARGPWDVKLRAGGLIEVEFVVQALQLLHARDPALLSPCTRVAAARLAASGALAAADAGTLIEADRTWRAVQGMLRIMFGREIPARLGAPALEKLSAAAGLGGAAASEAGLLEALDLLAARVRGIFVRQLGEVPAL